MRSFFLLLFSLAATFCHAQLGYVKFGYTGNVTNLDGMNAVVANYNASRPWLSKQMKEFGYLDGFGLGFGAGADAMYFDLSFNFTGQKRSAGGTDSTTGIAMTRDMKFKNNYGSLTFGVATGDQVVAIGFGLMTQLGSDKLLTRVYADGTDPGDWEKIHDNISCRVGPALMFAVGGPIKLMCNVYYCFAPVKTNLTTLDEKVNNTFYNYETQKKFDMRDNCFGFSISSSIFYTE